jgi:N-acetylglucosamine-6-sulfatase
VPPTDEQSAVVPEPDGYPMRVIAALFLFLSFAMPAWARPNIVVIMTDDQEDTGSMAYLPKVHALLAERGITFTNSFVNLSLCCPSRVSFLTGQAAHNHGVKSNDAAKGGGWQAFKDKEGNALPVWLKSAGYNTALIGKYINGYGKDKHEQTHNAASAGGPNLEGKTATQSTVDYCIGLLGKIANIFGKSTAAGADWLPAGWDRWFAFNQVSYYNYRVNDNGTIRKFGKAASDYSTDVLKDRAVQYIKDQSAATTPFFLFVATKTPHGIGEATEEGGEEEGAATPAPNYAQKFMDVGLPTGPAFNEQDVSDKPRWVRNAPSLDAPAKRRLENIYRAELQSLQSVDDLVEAIVNALQSANKLDDTIIVFTSDNGFMYGDHRLKSKLVAYEGSIRVPLVIRGPGIPENQTRSQLVNNLDLVATIEDLAEATPGLVPDGRSLAPLFAGNDVSWRQALLAEGGDDTASATRRFAAVRTASRKYVKYDDGFEELYDLSTDPNELDNKARDAAFASDLAMLRSQYDTLKSCAGVSCWVGR